MVVEHREFVIVRVRTAGGAEGIVYSLTRDAPLDLVLTEYLGPRLIGHDALDTEGVHEVLVRGAASLGAVGLVGRAISLIDIGLWDIKGQVAGMPAWRLLGGHAATAPIGLVAPHAAADEPEEAYAERLAVLAARGYDNLKLYPLSDPDAMRRRLATIRARVGPDVGLVVDMAWSFRSVPEAIAAVRSWEEFRLRWVEDPFPADDWRSIRALSEAVETPIAVGDEVSVAATMERLISERAVDIVRLDATSIGGFTSFASIRALASRAGLSISPHAYGEIHRHCVHAWPGVSPVEIFQPASPTWGTSRFMVDELDLPEGRAEVDAPTAPGLGLSIDWTAVEALSDRHTSTDRTTSTVR
jgi:L-alanine-DL-glutamate epimerase-like enolase superfamily enzyme